MKEFNEFVKRGIIKKQEPNKTRAKDLIEESERKNKSLSLIIEKIGVIKENANDIIEYCYDIILSLLRAKLLLEGFSSSGAHAHEAEISYLKSLGFLEADIESIDELRYIRNRIKYYGKRNNLEYAEKILKLKDKTINKLNNVLALN
jgi:hypothetical protein